MTVGRRATAQERCCRTAPIARLPPPLSAFPLRAVKAFDDRAPRNSRQKRVGVGRLTGETLVEFVGQSGADDGHGRSVAPAQRAL